MQHATAALCLVLLSACGPKEAGESQVDAPAASVVNSDSGSTAVAAPIGEEVSVTGGLVRGLVAADSENALKQYHNIPFVAPPLGNLRWAPPAPVVPWEGTLDATAHGAFCMQTETVGVTIYIETRSRAEQSEDCLTINVWTRADNIDERRPVMVWVHGGGLQGGAGFEQTGDLLTEKGVVLVSFNYRLGRFGFFSHPELSAEHPKGVSGNQGFRDQIAALEWVRDNITQFGGNPNNVTIFGESAGSTSVNALQASPLARGLFHRVIGQSGGAFHPQADRTTNKPHAPAGESIGVMFAKALVGEGGDTSLAALRKLPAEKIVEVSNSSPAFNTYEYLPIVDGEVLPDQMAAIYSRGEQADVPTMIGSNANEGAAVMGHFTSFLGDGEEGFGRFKQGLLGEVAGDADMELLYPVDNPLGVMQSWQELFEDITFTYPMRRWARDMSGVSSDAYLYLYTWHPPTAGKQYKSFHGADLGYVFGQLTMFGAEPSEEDEAFSDFIADTWVRFAKTGNPNGGEIQNWPAFTADNEAYYVLGATHGPAKELRMDQMALIERAWTKRRASGVAANDAE
ncbi:MAG: carboxylesterase/lipase family protein [Pseudomonadales bacterium]